MTLSIIQMVPALPPYMDGVRDYAVRLGHALRAQGIESAFLACGDGLTRQEVDGFAASSLPERSAETFAKTLASSATGIVLLHYSGYGYASRGTPAWLVSGLRRWKTGASQRRLVVMFHELWAFGPPWTSSFWLFPLQRALAAAILHLADAFLTNTDLSAARLRRLASDRSPVAVLPVLSNIGEPNELPPFEAREPLAVVFGQRSMRVRVYVHMDDFLPILRSAGIEGILDIGPPLERAITRAPLQVIHCGYLQPTSASAVMLRARFGLLDYPLDFAAKSGIFAAYTAHGLVPLLRSAINGEHDGLRHGVNLMCVGEPTPGLRAPTQGLATAAHLWYQEHALERAVAYFAQALRPHGAAR